MLDLYLVVSISLLVFLMLLYIIKSVFSIIQKNKTKPVTPEPVKELTEYNSRYGELLKLGDRVICRSNEPDPLIVAEIIEFWNNCGKWDEPIIHVKDEKDGKIWGICGVVRLYDQELVDKLNTMPSIEQWNYLVQPHGQIAEKYGVTYKTYDK